MSSAEDSDGVERKRKRLSLDLADKGTIDYDEKIFKNQLILNYVLKNFTAKQLKSISRVSKSFNNLCSQLVKQYSKIEDLFLIYCLTKYMKKNDQRYSKLIRLKDVENYDNLKDEIINSIKNNVQTVPQIVLLFNSFRSCTFKNYSAFINSNKLIGLLPRSCSILSFSTINTGIIGNLEDCSVETMQDHKFISGISYIFLPDLTSDNCQIIPFKGCQSELCQYLSEEQIINCNIKGIITFIEYDPSKTPDLTILRELLGSQSTNVALGGVLVEHIDVSSNVDCKQSNPNETKSMIKTHFSAVMFCGNNVNCASLIIKDSEEETIKQRLIDFKNGLHFDFEKPNSEFFGFLFACSGRGFNIFNKLNVESDLVREQFPNLKLYGIFGLGEVGLNYYGNYRTNKVRKDEVLHYFTSVLFIVHITKS